MPDTPPQAEQIGPMLAHEKKPNTWVKWTVLLVIAFVIVVLALWYWHYSTVVPSTDDAYVNANIVYIAPEVEGKVKTLSVTNLQTVKPGQLLLTLDPTQYQYAVNQATAQLNLEKARASADEEAIKVTQAKLAQAVAKQFVAKQKADRILALVKQKLESPELGDEVQGNLEVTNALVNAAKEQVAQAQQDLLVQQAQVKAAEAALAQAQLNLNRTRLYAPSAGAIANLTVRPGALLVSGQTILAIVNTDTFWVDANYKETDLQRIRPGQPAKITLDMYPGHAFEGTVLSVSRGSGSTFSLLPPENATGNWVKVTQRFPIRIAIPEAALSPAYPLRVGASAVVRIDTRKH